MHIPVYIRLSLYNQAKLHDFQRGNIEGTDCHGFSLNFFFIRPSKARKLTFSLDCRITSSRSNVDTRMKFLMKLFHAFHVLFGRKEIRRDGLMHPAIHMHSIDE